MENVNFMRILSNIGKDIHHPSDMKIYHEHMTNDEMDGCVLFQNGTRGWYKKGVIHRENAPAVIRPDNSCVFYINGVMKLYKEVMGESYYCVVPPNGMYLGIVFKHDDIKYLNNIRESMGYEVEASRKLGKLDEYQEYNNMSVRDKDLIKTRIIKFGKHELLWTYGDHDNVVENIRGSIKTVPTDNLVQQDILFSGIGGITPIVGGISSTSVKNSDPIGMEHKTWKERDVAAKYLHQRDLMRKREFENNISGKECYYEFRDMMKNFGWDSYTMEKFQNIRIKRREEREKERMRIKEMKKQAKIEAMESVTPKHTHISSDILHNMNREIAESMGYFLKDFCGTNIKAVCRKGKVIKIYKIFLMGDINKFDIKRNIINLAKV
jgi:hypothetical protein